MQNKYNSDSIKSLKPALGIIWDCDGTILDSMVPQHAWLNLAAKKYGGQIKHSQFCPEFLTEYNQAYALGGMKGLYTMMNIDFEKHRREIWDDYNLFNQTHPISAVSGVANAFKKIYANTRVNVNRSNAVRMGLHTTKSIRDIEIPLKKEGLLKLFDNKITKEDIYNIATNGKTKQYNIPLDDYKTLRTLIPEELVKQLEKPNSLGAIFALSNMGFQHQKIIAIEDNVTGLQTYQNMILHPYGAVDIFTIGVTWGYQNKTELLTANPNIIVDTPKELVEIVLDLVNP